MPDQASPELTTRDVLSQVARRIELLETDVRKLDAKIDARFDALDAKTDARFEAQNAKTDTRFDAQDAKIDALSAMIDARFRHLTRTIIAVASLFVAVAGAFVAYLTLFRNLPA